MGDAGRAMMQQGKEAVRGVAAAAAQAVHQGLGAEPLEQFTDAWRQAEHLLENYHGDGDASPGTAVSADRCEALRSVLRRINELLEAEWEVEKAERQGRSTGNLMRGEDAGPCLEYLIRNVGGKGKLHVLCDNCDRSHPVEVRLVITEALRKMFMAVRHPLFWGSPMVQTPLREFAPTLPRSCCPFHRRRRPGSRDRVLTWVLSPRREFSAGEPDEGAATP
jgi:hypothetical protein